MKIKNLELKGWRSYSDVEGVTISDLKRINLFIGPNNTGKSNLFKYLFFLRKMALTHDEQNSVNIQGGFENYSLFNSIPYAFGQRDTWKFSTGKIVCKISLEDINQTWASREPTLHKCVIPLILKADHNCAAGRSCLSVLYLKDKPLIEEYGSANGSQPKLFNVETGAYENPREGMKYPNDTYDYWLAFLNSLVFVDPVRHYARATSTVGESDFDGSEIVQQLIELRNNRDGDAEWANFRDTFEHWLKDILDEPLFDLDPTDTELRFYIRRGGERISAGLQYLGTGVSQMIMLLAYLYLNKERSLNVFIEEPESNLHPEAVIQLVKVIEGEFPNHRLFITTHSTVLVDQVNEHWSIHRVSRKDDKCTTITPCNEVVQQYQLLDELGIRPSQLLQSNLVIWVEGPSDRTYIKKWLSSRSTFIEGKHYTFMMYGGSNLSSYDFLSSDEYIDVLKTSRFAVIVCDSDKETQGALLKDRVQKLLDHLEETTIEDGVKLSNYVYVWVTNGREIENYIPPKILKSVVFSEGILRKRIFHEGKSQQLKTVTDEVQFSFGQFDSFDNICAQRYTLADGSLLTQSQMDTIASGLSNKKAKIAKLVVEQWGDTPCDIYDLSFQLDKLMEFINRANFKELTLASKTEGDLILSS